MGKAANHHMAEIKTRILRVYHVKKTRIYTMSHVKNPYLTCVSCALYFSTCRLQYTLATELPAILAIVSDQSRGPTRKDVQPCYMPFHVSPSPTSPTHRSLLTETANSEQLLIVTAVLHVVSSSQAGRTALF